MMQVLGIIFNLALAEIVQYLSNTPFESLKYIEFRIAIDVIVVAIGAFALFVIKESRANIFATTIFVLVLTVIVAFAALIFNLIQMGFGYDKFQIKAIITFGYMIFAGLLVINVVIAKIINNVKFKTIIVHSSACNDRFLNKLIRDSKPFGEVDHFVLDELNDETFGEFCELLKEYDKFVFLEDLDDDTIYKLSFETIKNRRISQTMPDIQSLSHMSGTLANIGDTPFMSVKIRNGIMFDTIVKRIFDFIASTFLIIILLPLFIIIAIAIKLEDHGPVFYKQERYTIFKRKFLIYKFRSMRTDAEKFGAMYAQENDPRITKVGKFIRAVRLDELPQLINIWKGEMSFVGPRPERPIFADEYSEIVQDYDMRYLVKSGLTGYAQICGKYNTDIEDKQLYDIIYVTKFSLAMDLEIILRTVVVIFTKDATDGYEQGTEITQTAKENAKKQEVTSNE